MIQFSKQKQNKMISTFKPVESSALPLHLVKLNTTLPSLTSKMKKPSRLDFSNLDMQQTQKMNGDLSKLLEPLELKKQQPIQNHLMREQTIKSSFKKQLTIDTSTADKINRFKNLLPVRFERKSQIGESPSDFNRTDGFFDQRLPELEQRKPINPGNLQIEIQPSPKSKKQNNLRNVSPTEIIKLSLAFHGNLIGGESPMGFMDMFRIIRGITPSSNSRRNSNRNAGDTKRSPVASGRSSVYSPTRSRASNSKGFNSRGFEYIKLDTEIKRDDDSPIRRKIDARNIRHNKISIDDLYSSDISAVKKLKIQEEKKEEILRRLKPDFASQKKRHSPRPTHAEQRAIDKMFRKKPSPKDDDIIVPIKTKILPSIKVHQYNESYLNRLAQPKESSKRRVTKLNTISSVESIETPRKNNRFDEPVQVDKNKILAKELGQKQQEFLMKSTFWRDIQEKLNELGYLQRPIRNLNAEAGEINARRKMQPQTYQKIHNASRIYSQRYDAPPISPFNKKYKSQIRHGELQTEESQLEKDQLLRSFEIEETLTKRPSKRKIQSLKHTTINQDTSMTVKGSQTKLLSLPYIAKNQRQVYQSMELFSSKNRYQSSIEEQDHCFMFSPRERDLIRQENLQKREQGWQLRSQDYEQQKKIQIRQRKIKLEI